jgi:transposase
MIAGLINNRPLCLAHNKMFISREEKERRVIDLYNQGKTTREIIKELRVSPNYVSAVLKKEEEKNNSIVTNNQHQSSSSLSAKAYELFSKGKTPVEVAISLNLRAYQATKYYREYWNLRGLHKLNLIYKETNGKLGPFLKLYRLVKEKGLSIEQVVTAVDIAIHKLPFMDSLYRQAKDEVDKLQYTIQRLVNDIQVREYKISILDKTAFSIEQDCRRKEQQLQELTAQKERLEKLIANIVNGEGYSKLNLIAKENVKVVLSENKKLISISFVALIQTIKADPQMVKLIQNMPSANDGEQYKDNNNIIKYLELNKDRILNLGEKNYENLVEELTNNAINTVADYSLSNPTLSLPQSSSPTFPDLFTQSYIFRIEESYTHHNSTGDITE